MRVALLSIFLLLVLSVFAQEAEPKRGFRISAVQLSIGVSIDQYRNLDHDHISRTAANPEDLEFDKTDYKATFGKRAGASSFFTNLLISPKELNNNSLANRSQFTLGFGLHSHREMRAGYSSEALDTTINFCNLSSERSIEFGYMINFFPVEKKSTLFAGIGCNFSTTRNNEVMIISGRYIEDDEHPSVLVARPDSDLTFEAKAIAHARIFALLGFNKIYNDWMEFSFQLRPGFGVQMVPDAKTKIIPYTGGFNLGMRFYFHRIDIPQ